MATRRAVSRELETSLQPGMFRVRLLSQARCRPQLELTTPERLHEELHSFGQLDLDTRLIGTRPQTMAVTRPLSLCLSCQVRQAAIGRRLSSIYGQRHLQTIAESPDSHGFLPTKVDSGYTSDDGIDVRTCGVIDGVLHGKDWSPVDHIREAVEDFNALCRTKHSRVETLRKLSNPWPERPPGGRHRMPPRGPIVLPEAEAALIPHAQFRDNLRSAMGDKAIRQVLRKQLLRCEWPQDILRIVAVAMQTPQLAGNLSTIYEPIMRALYRCRQNVSDANVLRTLNTIITRFQYACLEVNPNLIFMALKFAARSRSLAHMKKFLKLIREQNLTLSSNVFRSTIAKFSIGHRGLGEIRNGRWRRQDLMQVLTGFHDAKGLPPTQQYHFGSFLDRDDWQQLHGWVAVLARCKEADAVWREWLLWRQSPARKLPKQLINNEVSTKIRGDYWFVEQMAVTGDAWRTRQILEDTGIRFPTLKTGVKDMYLEAADDTTVWDVDTRREMVKKYDRDLAKVEKALGVKWQAGEEDGKGHHELLEDQEDVLDRLGDPEWRLDEQFGYPYDDDEPIVPHREKPLQYAEESSRKG